MNKRFKVQIRRNLGLIVKPEAEKTDGNIYTFRKGWVMDEDDPLPGETAWIVYDNTYPEDAPIWLASGDLVEV